MKNAAFAILFTLATAAASAQTPPGAPATANARTQMSLEQRAEAITNSLVQNLRLNPEQAKQLYVINLSSLTNVEQAKQKYKANPRKLVHQIDVISETRLSQIKDVLSPLQFQQYQQRREEKMGVPKEAQSNPQARQQSLLNQESY